MIALSKHRLTDLDGLRALAVLLVIWDHTTRIDLGIGGYHGVLLFFVISGFLITGILLGVRGKATPLLSRAGVCNLQHRIRSDRRRHRCPY